MSKDTINTLTEDQRKELLQWAEALESGKYAQGTERLRWVGDNVCQYCCLGVFAEMHGAKWHDGGEDGILPYIGDDKISAGIDEYLAYDWFEKQTGIDKKGQTLLSQANDNYRWDFKRIAQAVRKYAETGKPGMLDPHPLED